MPQHGQKTRPENLPQGPEHLVSSVFIAALQDALGIRLDKNGYGRLDPGYRCLPEDRQAAIEFLADPEVWRWAEEYLEPGALEVVRKELKGTGIIASPFFME